MPGPFPNGVLVLGTGLIGTSVALALCAHDVDVRLSDRDPAHLQIATGLGAGRVDGPTDGAPDLIVLAVPPAAVPAEVAAVQRRHPGVPVTDVSSAAGSVRRATREQGGELIRFVSSHPMAGRETSGPAGASAELFEGRNWWVLTEPGLDRAARDRVVELVALAGARLVEASAAEHDAAVAQVSHLPQILASVLAAQLAQSPQTQGPQIVEPDLRLRLAGPAFREMTRVAASSPELWTDILQANAEEVSKVLSSVAGELQALAGDLGTAGLAGASGLLRRGNAGRDSLIERGRLP